MALGNVKLRKRPHKKKVSVVAPTSSDKPDVIPTLTRLQILGDSSYATGGNTGLAAAIAGRIQNHAHIVAILVVADGYTARYDHATDKLIVYAGTSEVASTTDLSAVKFHLTIWSHA